MSKLFLDLLGLSCTCEERKLSCNGPCVENTDCSFGVEHIDGTTGVWSSFLLTHDRDVGIKSLPGSSNPKDMNVQKLSGSERLNQVKQDLRTKENNFGPDSIKCVPLLTNLASALGIQGQLQPQKEVMERILKIVEQYYGSEHLKVAEILVDLGTLHGKFGETMKKKDLLERALRIQGLKLGPNNATIAMTKARLGNAYGNLGDPTQQVELLASALLVLEREFGEKHIEVAAVLTNLGNAYGLLGDMEAQQQHLERSLAIKEGLFGLHHPELAATLTSLGTVCGDLGDVHKQKEHFARALDIRETVYGPDHISVGILLATLGCVYAKRQDWDRALEALDRSLSIKEKVYGVNHPQVAQTQANLASVYGRLGKITEAVQLLEYALPIFERSFGKDHPHTTRVHRTLDTFKSLMGCALSPSAKSVKSHTSYKSAKSHTSFKSPKSRTSCGNRSNNSDIFWVRPPWESEDDVVVKDPIGKNIFDRKHSIVIENEVDALATVEANALSIDMKPPGSPVASSESQASLSPRSNNASAQAKTKRVIVPPLQLYRVQQSMQLSNTHPRIEYHLQEWPEEPAVIWPYIKRPKLPSESGSEVQHPFPPEEVVEKTLQATL